ncbi:helix-turn-helix domain-containing protein [Nakamurella multipartita]|uniref:helix-turn-helix domain-containing protein n=1 Tax=Nakamurella multipartita TaxID=53461 RepID=UPI0038994B4A
MQTYGLGKGAVLRVLKEAGVEMRHQGLNDEDQDEAVRRYIQGQSAARVADQLGCSPDHVLACVRRAGHPVRPRVGGRQRKQPQ